MEIPILVAVLILTVASVVSGTFANLDPEQCGWQNEGELCHNNLCCSKWGFCGSTDVYCNEGCQSQCSGGGVPPSSPPPPTPSPPPPPSPSPPPPSPSPPPPVPGGVEELLSSSQFNEMLPRLNAGMIRRFYSYEGFVTASKTFPEFARTGDISTRKREIAAFLGQTSFETAGWYRYDTYDGYAYGYMENYDVYTLSLESSREYCIQSVQWPCASSKIKYYGRGPINLKYNTNYGPAGEALGYDLLNNPDLLTTNETLSFESALWFWMTPRPPKPSSHDVITENWVPSPADVVAGRLSGYGMVTNIINGDRECGIGYIWAGKMRVGYYKRYCDMLGTSYGDNLDCFNQIPFGHNSLTANTYIE